MRSEATKSFLSSVASAMFAYKRYLTHNDYINVWRSIIQQYVFMAQPTGAPYVSIFLLLKIMLYNFLSLGWYCTIIIELLNLDVQQTVCGLSFSATQVTTSKKSPKRKSPGITQTPKRPPLLSPGEDAVSLERHDDNLLKGKFKRKKQNDTVVSDFWKKTSPLRRQTILEKPMNVD